MSLFHINSLHALLGLKQAFKTLSDLPACTGEMYARFVGRQCSSSLPALYFAGQIIRPQTHKNVLAMHFNEKGGEIRSEPNNHTIVCDDLWQLHAPVKTLRVCTYGNNNRISHKPKPKIYLMPL